MANHSSGDQISYVLQWFGGWSDFQKDDFVHIIAPKVSREQYVNGLVNGFQSLDTSGRPPSLFACQVKLFNEWWNSWNEADQKRMLNQLETLDPKFWSEVEAEVSGGRKKHEDDFFAVPATVEAVSDITAENNNCDVSEAEEMKESTTPVGSSDLKVAEVIEHSHENEEETKKTVDT